MLCLLFSSGLLCQKPSQLGPGMNIFGICLQNSAEFILRCCFLVQICQEAAPFGVEGGGEHAAVQTGIQSLYQREGKLAHGSVLFGNGVQQAQGQPGPGLAEQVQIAVLEAAVDGIQIIPVENLSHRELISLLDGTLLHNLFQEIFNLQCVHGVQKLRHQFVDGEGIPVEEEEELGDDVVLGKEGLIVLPENHRLHMFLHAPFVHGFHQVGLRQLEVAAEQGSGDRYMEMGTQGNDTVELLGALFKLQLLAQDGLPFVPVHTQILRLGGEVPEPELGTVDQLYQTDASLAVIHHDLPDGIVFGDGPDLAHAEHDRYGIFQDLLPARIIFRYEFHRIILDAEGIFYVFIHHGCHGGAVEPVVEKIVVGIRHSGKPVCAFRHQKLQTGFARPVFAQGGESAGPEGRAVHAQQRPPASGNDAEDVLIKLGGLGIGQRQVLVRGEPKGDIAAFGPGNGGAEHDGGFAGAALARENDGFSAAAQLQQPFVHLFVRNIPPAADHTQHHREAEIQHAEFVQIFLRHFPGGSLDGIPVQDPGNGGNAVPGLNSACGFNLQMLVQVIQNLFKGIQLHMLDLIGKIRQVQDLQCIIFGGEFFPAGELIVHCQDQEDQLAVFIAQGIAVGCVAEALHGFTCLLARVGGADLHSHTAAVFCIRIHQVDGLLIGMDLVGIAQVVPVNQIQQSCGNIFGSDIVA